MVNTINNCQGIWLTPGWEGFADKEGFVPDEEGFADEKGFVPDEEGFVDEVGFVSGGFVDKVGFVSGGLVDERGFVSGGFVSVERLFVVWGLFAVLLLLRLCLYLIPAMTATTAKVPPITDPIIVAAASLIRPPYINIWDIVM